MKIFLSGLLFFVMLFLGTVGGAWAITATFDSYGASGSLHGQEISFNAFNQVYEWNANLNVDGVSNWLSNGPIDGIGFSFSSDVNETSFRQTYNFINTGDSLINNLTFYSFLDAELDGAWWDDMASHTQPLAAGHPLLKQYDYNSGTSIYLSGIFVSGSEWTYDKQFANGWEIDYSGNVWSDINDGLGLTNAVSAPFNAYGDDYAAALRWNLGDLDVRESVHLTMMVSTDGA